MTFSKHDTQITKGVAVFLLVCFHCFSSSDRMYGYEVSFAPFSRSLGFNVFWAFHVCVGMFVFLSAFGLTRILKAQRSSLQFSLLEQLQFTTKRLFSLLSPFLFTAVICVALHYAITGKWAYGTGWAMPLNLLADLLGIGALLGTPISCGSWWFISLMWALLLLFPFFIALYRKYGVLVLPLFVILPLFIPFEGRAKIIVNWMTSVPVGIYCADCNLLERWKEKKLVASPTGSLLLKLLIMAPLTIAVGAVFQSSWGRSHFPSLVFPLFSLIAVADVYLFLADIPVLKQILAFLGKHSAYIFYIHSFIRAYWLRELTYSFGHWLPIALFLLACSIACSYLMQFLQRLVRWDKGTALLRDKVLRLEERLSPSRETAA